jgi:hypothetical protein
MIQQFPRCLMAVVASMSYFGIGWKMSRRVEVMANGCLQDLDAIEKIASELLAS